MSEIIYLNTDKTARFRFVGGISGDTVTYSIIGPDGTVFSSGLASWVAQGLFSISFTPKAIGNYSVSVFNQSSDLKHGSSFICKTIG
jgi:hypothetical protein